MGRYLAVLEVSQKQAYIFSKNELAENVRRSEIIAKIMQASYIEEIVNDKTVFNKEGNFVYSGGGRTILVFTNGEHAKETIYIMTKNAMETYPDIILFGTTREYDDHISAGDNVRKLNEQLEKKKAERLAGFHQGTFGVERTDDDGNVVMIGNAPKEEHSEEHVPSWFKSTTKLGKLSIDNTSPSFIAIVHVDGNAMGRRVDDITKNAANDWEEYKKSIRKFSESIDHHYKEAFQKMQEKIGGCLAGVDKKERNVYFPIRRIISAGDDICFVTDGRIGLKAADIFIQELNKLQNEEDGQNYHACAGVALVHQKYPFYRAYELSEALCSNAKRFGASLSADGTGSDISCIDWHIEYGELRDTLEETRKQYIAKDGVLMELRPYIISATEAVMKKEPIRRYDNFKKLMQVLQNSEEYGRGIFKELRSKIKQGYGAAEYFLKFHRADALIRDVYQDVFVTIDYNAAFSGKGLAGKLTEVTADQKEHSLIFDAIEMMDLYTELEGEDR